MTALAIIVDVMFAMYVFNFITAFLGAFVSSRWAGRPTTKTWADALLARNRRLLVGVILVNQ